MEAQELKKELDLDIDGGHLVVKGNFAVGEMVAVNLSVNVGIVCVLEAIANKTKTPIDNAAIPYLKMIIAALER